MKIKTENIRSRLRSRWAIAIFAIAAVGVVLIPRRQFREDISFQAAAVARIVALASENSTGKEINRNDVMSIPGVVGFRIGEKFSRTDGDASEKGVVFASEATPSGGVVVAMSPPKKPPLSFVEIMSSLMLAGAAVRLFIPPRKRAIAEHAQKDDSGIESAPREEKLVAADHAEKLSDCAILLVDQGRRVTAAGTRGSKYLDGTVACSNHLIDIASGDELQDVLGMFREAEMKGETFRRVKWQSSPSLIRVIKRDNDFILAIKTIEDGADL